MNQVNAVRALAQILRRYTSLNHLAQAARAVLQNSNQITQMLADINKVDFTSVQVGLARDNFLSEVTSQDICRSQSHINVTVFLQFWCSG